MELLHAIWGFLNSHTTETLAVLVGSGGVAVTIDAVLHKAGTSSQKVAHVLLQVFSIVTSLVTFFVASITPENATGIYAAVFIVASMWRRFIISPVYLSVVLPFLQYKASQKATVPASQQPTQPLPEQPESQDNFVSR